MIQDAVRSVWALFLGIAILMIGNGLQGSLLGIRANIEGFETAIIGIVMAGYYIGFLISSVITPRLVSRVGHIRVFAAYASLASASILVHTLVPNPWAWMFLRFLTGIAIAGLYVVSESWLNQTATNETRGKIFSIYMMIVSGFMALGQFVLPLADPAGPVLFIVVSILVSVALIPISLSNTPAPTILQYETLRLREIYRLSPLGVVGCFMCGIAQGGLFSMGPVYAAEIGMGSAEIALFMSLPFVGLLLIQYPMGALSDRIDRRRVITSCATVAALAACGLALVGTAGGLPLFALFIVYGALAAVLYGLSVAHANDYVPTEKVLPASAMLVLTYAVGSIVGPVIAGYGMSILGPQTLFSIGALIHVGIAVFALYRMTRRPTVAAEDRGEYVPIAARATPIAATAAIEGAIDAAESEGDSPDDEGPPFVSVELDDKS